MNFLNLLEVATFSFTFISLVNAAVCAMPSPRCTYCFYYWLYHFMHYAVSIARSWADQKYHANIPDLTPEDGGFTVSTSKTTTAQITANP
jgi:hypothetical protein